MILLKYKDSFIKFILCSITLIIVMLILSKVFYKEVEENDIISDDVTSNINYSDDKTIVNVDYPRFNNDKINKLVTDSLYSYVKDFRNHDEEKSLTIKYDLYKIDKYVNIQYTIENSLDNIKHDNMLIDTEKAQIAYITSLYDEEYLKNEIFTLVKENLSEDEYKKIIKDTINNFTYIMSDDTINVFFNNIKNKPNVTINYKLESFGNDNNLDKEKYIILSYDDGPSEYTSQILSVLEKHNSSATFFMSGKNMKNYTDVVKEVYNSNSEVASQGYSHVDLSGETDDDIDMEVSVTNVLFNEITGSRLEYFHPPYNLYNDYMNYIDLKTVYIDIDTKDWLIKNSKLIVDNVINNACDGCIVLMRDTYKTSINLTEKLITELNKLGYKIVSISEYNKLIEE